jgi:hypothetical protein
MGPATAPSPTDTVLHIDAGMAVPRLVRAATGRSLAVPWPLLAVYLAELVNEILDRVNHGQRMPDTTSDLLNTVFWPTVLFVGLRVRRARLEHFPQVAASAAGWKAPDMWPEGRGSVVTDFRPRTGSRRGIQSKRAQSACPAGHRQAGVARPGEASRPWTGRAG